jgi:hypothetical protein
MKERPILFSGPMVRALLDGTKTQTRRIVEFDHSPTGNPTLMDNEEPVYWAWGFDHYVCPYGVPGDRLWVRETWNRTNPGGAEGLYYFKADGCGPHGLNFHGDELWRPSIFMPRAACRLFLEITEVRVERLQDISEKDAKAEGVLVGEPDNQYPSFRDAYASLWDSLNAKRGYGWDKNPWVWVVTFKRIKP